MNARGVILAIGAVMVTTGMLIELAGYTSNRAAADATNPTLRRPVATPGLIGGSENAPLSPTTKVRLAQATADDPYRAVHYVYRAITNGSATGCALFSPTAAQQFAEHFHASDCPAATTQLATQVTRAIKYASTGQRSRDVYLGDTMTISSCEISPEGGPPLGRFTLQRIKDRWYISAHETETC